MVHEVEDFHGVYLLCSLNPRYKGRTYIGYTVNPNRRIKQHNAGSQAGGACRTSGRGPWEMALIIHGFPNNISALQFEWAWQNPDKCRRLRDAPVLKRRSETAFQHRWRIACLLLQVGPWYRFALTIRWLKQDYKLDFPTDLSAPLHMPVVFGPVISKTIQDKGISPKKRLKPLADEESALEEELNSIPRLIRNNRVCAVCHRKLEPNDKRLMCFLPNCQMVSHIICLANRFIGNAQTMDLIPIQGACPGCKQTLLWGDLVRHFRGCYQNLSQSATDNGQADQAAHWADEVHLSQV